MKTWYKNYLHEWVRLHKGRKMECEINPDHKSKFYDWANISRKYKKDLNDWIRLCRKCHAVFDGQKLTVEELKKQELIKLLLADKQIPKKYLQQEQEEENKIPPEIEERIKKLKYSRKKIINPYT